MTIDNFRDVGESVPGIVEGVFFRSAIIENATPVEILHLSELGIKTIIDLQAEKSDSTSSRHKMMIRFTGSKFRKNAVWKSAPFDVKLDIMFSYVFRSQSAAAKVVGEEVLSKAGIEGLYRSFIDYCGEQICRSLCVISNPSNLPVLVHCSQGKDRTGIVTALALAAVGIDDEKIIHDYTKSQQGLQPISNVVAQMAEKGLDSSFADSPASCMEATFAHIRNQYGSIDEYLDYIGFNEGARKTLTSILRPTANNQLPPDHPSYLPYNITLPPLLSDMG